jgi:hypothetical protein
MGVLNCDPTHSKLWGTGFIGGFEADPPYKSCSFVGRCGHLPGTSSYYCSSVIIL